MRIETMFQRDIFRPINGVVKADQLDESSVWQELDEFVITRELDGHLRKFFSVYLDAIDRPNDADIIGKIGVWVSGFFGSGKSHFIKVLSYLLENREHTCEGQKKNAVEFFETKVEDAMFLGDMKRAVNSGADVILFNIDSKADERAGRDTILHVFLKVLNEKQGYSPDYPHIAHMERYLESEGKLSGFHEAYKRLTDADWLDERDAYEFNRDNVLQALSETLGQSTESLEKWIDKGEENLPLSAENFAKWTRGYLDRCGPNHRIVFLVDEIGQFIGGDTHLMLKLQTIVEELGTVCGGRAWVVVTSQEDIDKVIGEVHGARLDFSKITGRFVTRLSLSSTNVDEVIQQRLLAKSNDATKELTALYEDKGDIIKNQLAFSTASLNLKSLRNSEDFAANYPFVPYQFRLLQMIFESIRKVGATGLHLAQGERSLLDAFQSAAKQIANEETGVLVPLYRFYPSIESFLEGSVRRTMDDATNSTELEVFDCELLKALFLIRYVEKLKGNVDNLVTLCIDRTDADRHKLRRQIEESLQRLEKMTLISRSGDNHQFLTNEERDINREIKEVDLTSGEYAKFLGNALYEDVLTGHKKHRFTVNSMDFPFNRLCDLYPIGNRTDGAMQTSIISPLLDDYLLYDNSKCVLESANDDGQVVIRLKNEATLGRELRGYLQTDKYIRTRDDGTKVIIRQLADENRERKDRVVGLLEELLKEADYFVAGNPFTPKASSALGILGEALEYLILNTFTKMSLLAHLNDNRLKEIQAILNSNDIAQQNLDIQMQESNPGAINEIRAYVDLCTRSSKQIVLHDLIAGKYARRPYGWPEHEVALILSRLIILGEVQLVTGGAIVPKNKLYDTLTTQSLWKKTQIVQRKTADPAAIQKARNIAKDVFAQIAPDGEDPLAAHLRSQLTSWQSDLQQWSPLADTGNYPGREEITEGLGIVSSLLSCEDSRKLVDRFNEQEADIREFADAFGDLVQFYKHQRPTWEKLRAAYAQFQSNRIELERDATAAPSFQRMYEILSATAPYALISEVEALVLLVSGVNAELVAQRRARAHHKVQKTLEQMTKEAECARVDDTTKRACLEGLEKLQGQIDRQESLAHIAQTEAEAERAFEAGMQKLEAAAHTKEPPAGEGSTSPPSPPAIKARFVLKPSELLSKPYLETPEDISAFVDTLRKTMEAAIADGKRIQIK